MIEIKNGDCLELLKHLDDGSVDLTVTSPPYDNLRSYNGNIDQWCFAKFQEIAKELHRVTKPGGVVVWIVADATVKGSETGTSFKQALYFKDCGFNLHDTMIWRKVSPYQHKNRYISCFEYMFVFSKDAPKTVNLIRDRKNKYAGDKSHGTERLASGVTRPRSETQRKNVVAEYGARFNIWDIPGQRNRGQIHPAVFPERLIADHIISWSNPGDVVLDPFMGSGTTGVACIQTGRRFIGFEICDEYFNIARERIANRQGKASERNPE